MNVLQDQGATGTRLPEKDFMYGISYTVQEQAI